MRLILAILLCCVSLARADYFVIAEGDSLTYGTGATAGSNYVAQMHLPAGTWTNLGKAGDVISANTSATNVLQTLTNVSASRRYVVLLMGINDIAVNDSVATVTTNLGTFCQSVRAVYPSAKIIGCTLYGADLNSTLTQRRFDVNAWITNANGNYDATVDLNADSRLTNHADTTYFDADGIHLKDAGYAVVAELVKAGLAGAGAFGYYVSTNGSDSADGSQATPWQTIQHAADTVTAGDTITVTAGRYSENVTVDTSSNVTFIASGAVTNYGWQISKQFTALHGFTLLGSNIVNPDACVTWLAGSSYGLASNITILGYGSASAGAMGVTMAANPGVTNIVIDSCRFINPNSVAITMTGTGHTVTNCYFTGTNGWDALRVVACNSVITASTFTNWSNPGEWNPNHTDLIQTLGDNDDVSTNVTFSRNLAINCEGCQLGNFSDDWETNDVSSWRFINNLYVRVASTFNVYAPNFWFLNNTFYRCVTNGGQVISAGSSGAGHGTNMVILNNLFVECGELPDTVSRGWYYSPDATNGWSAATINNNLVVGVGAGLVKSADFGIAGTETHGINGSDPLFVDAASGDFRLQTNSPAIAAGTNLTALGVTVDYTGATRTNFSMGALEGTGEAPEPPAGTTATPAISPAGGVFTNLVYATLSCATPGASIFWTVSGSATTNSTLYTAPLLVSETVTLSAIAAAPGYAASANASATFTKYTAPEPGPGDGLGGGAASVGVLQLDRVIRR